MKNNIIDFDALDSKLNNPIKDTNGLLTYKGGKVERTRANLFNIISEIDDKLKDTFRYNENTHDIEIIETKKLGAKLGALKAGRLDDSAINKVASYISMFYMVDFKPNEIHNEIEVIAGQNSYNPIKDFLEKSLEEAEKADPFLAIQKYLNIEDTEYNRIAFDLFFRGAVARVLNVGCQFDYCLDLTGKQGAGKTTFLREVFRLGYTEVNNYTERDNLMKMAESWVVNDDELVASNKTSFAELKQIITTRELSYRAPYGKSNLRIPVDFVFTRTTNEFQHLKDATGDRRFLPIKVFPKKKGQPNDISEEDLIAIWGNYYRSYRDNPVLFYDEDSKEGMIIIQEREKYKVEDEEIERLKWFLETLIPEDFYEPRFFPHDRQGFYKDLEQFGKAYRTANDRERGIEWEPKIPRTKVTTTVVVEEIFNDETEARKRNVKSKVRRYMDNLDGWSKKRRVRIGNKNPSPGWEKR